MNDLENKKENLAEEKTEGLQTKKQWQDPELSELSVDKTNYLGPGPGDGGGAYT